MQNLKHISESLDLQLYIMQGKNKHQRFKDIYEKTYLCWKSVWADVYKAEMGQDHQFYSDDFQRQDQIIALFSEDKCVGMAFVRHVDFDSLVVHNDSCFRYWPEDSIKEIIRLSTKVAIASYFTVHHDFRKSKLGICWKTLLLSLFVKNFLNTSSEIMITAARKKKSNEKLCYKLGAKAISTSVPYWIEGHKQVNEESVDIIYWNKKPLVLEDDHLNLISLKIWKSRIDLANTQQTDKEVENAS